MTFRDLPWLNRGLGRARNYAVSQAYRVEHRVFDWYSGTETAGSTETDVDAYNAGTENWPYLGCQWPALPWTLKDVPHDGSFIDLGSGKGKALLIAATLPYTRVIGVEIDSELSMAARRNIDRFRHRQRAAIIESVTASVIDWKVPDDSCVIFMHNAFFGATFKAAMENVLESYDRNPREVHLVYEFPWEHNWLLSTGRVEVESVRAEGWPRQSRWWEDQHVTVVYHLTAEGQPAGQCRSRRRRLSSAERKALQRWRSPVAHEFTVERKPL